MPVNRSVQAEGNEIHKPFSHTRTSSGIFEKIRKVVYLCMRSASRDPHGVMHTRANSSGSSNDSIVAHSTPLISASRMMADSYQSVLMMNNAPLPGFAQATLPLKASALQRVRRKKVAAGASFASLDDTVNSSFADSRNGSVTSSDEIVTSALGKGGGGVPAKGTSSSSAARRQELSLADITRRNRTRANTTSAAAPVPSARFDGNANATPNTNASSWPSMTSALTIGTVSASSARELPPSAPSSAVSLDHFQPSRLSFETSGERRFEFPPAAQHTATGSGGGGSSVRKEQQQQLPPSTTMPTTGIASMPATAAAAPVANQQPKIVNASVRDRSSSGLLSPLLQPNHYSLPRLPFAASSFSTGSSGGGSAFLVTVNTAVSRVSLTIQLAVIMLLLLLVHMLVLSAARDVAAQQLSRAHEATELAAYNLVAATEVFWRQTLYIKQLERSSPSPHPSLHSAGKKKQQQQQHQYLSKDAAKRVAEAKKHLAVMDTHRQESADKLCSLLASGSTSNMMIIAGPANNNSPTALKKRLLYLAEMSVAQRQAKTTPMVEWLGADITIAAPKDRSSAKADSTVAADKKSHLSHNDKISGSDLINMKTAPAVASTSSIQKMEQIAEGDEQEIIFADDDGDDDEFSAKKSPVQKSPTAGSPPAGEQLPVGLPFADVQMDNKRGDAAAERRSPRQQVVVPSAADPPPASPQPPVVSTSQPSSWSKPIAATLLFLLMILFAWM